ncbi:MAG: sugar transferase [Novosphingobium sp.]|uniref:sugar transferase n=1 Tax=Novosphingobium sp. TaxID=1874826 RepID=UPI0032BD81B4
MSVNHAVPGVHQDNPGKAAAAPYSPPEPLERRRLQSYLAQMLGDILAVFAGFCAGGYLYLGQEGLSQAAVLAQLLLPVYLTLALYNAAYSLAGLQSAVRGVQRALLSLAMAVAVVVFIAFYTKSSAEFSRVLFTGGAIFGALALVWLRFQMAAFVAWRCGARVTNELVIDDGGPVLELPGAFHVDAGAMELIPALDDPAALNRIGAVLHGIDRAVVSCPPARRAAWAMILKGANIDGEVLDDSVAELGAHGARITAGHGLLRVSIGPLGLRARASKRLFDLILAGGALIVLSSVLLVTCLAILLEDGAPILFVQRRVGRSNRFIQVYKFRSMRAARADRAGDTSTQRDDERLTRVGRFIRRTSIDELPQLINVIEGKMSLVGPRPHALGSQAGDKLFWEVDRRYWLRHALKPGLTGLAQVRGLRGATFVERDLADRLGADLEYLNGWSLWRDLRILIATLGVLVHEKAF